VAELHLVPVLSREEGSISICSLCPSVPTVSLSARLVLTAYVLRDASKSMIPSDSGPSGPILYL